MWAVLLGLAVYGLHLPMHPNLRFGIADCKKDDRDNLATKSLLFGIVGISLECSLCFKPSQGRNYT